MESGAFYGFITAFDGATLINLITMRNIVFSFSGFAVIDWKLIFVPNGIERSIIVEWIEFGTWNDASDQILSSAFNSDALSLSLLSSITLWFINVKWRFLVPLNFNNNRPRKQWRMSPLKRNFINFCHHLDSPTRHTIIAFFLGADIHLTS